jgi:hypothetical protein
VNFVRELSVAHVLADDTDQAVVRTFGEKGIADLTLLVGIYHIVCLLNVVKAPVSVSHCTFNPGSLIEARSRKDAPYP